MIKLDDFRLKTLLAGAMVLALFLTILISSFINIRQFSSMFYEVTENEHLPNVTERAKAQIRAELQAPIAFSQSIAQNAYIQQWILTGEDPAKTPDFVQYAQRFIRDYGAASVFWVSKPSNNYYNQDGLFKQVSQQVSRDAWFYDFVRGNQNTTLSLDIDEVTKSLTVFVNVLAKGPDGQVLGVAGLGYDVSAIIQMVQEHKVGETGYMFLLDSEGNIAAHREPNMLNKPLNQLSTYSEVAALIGASAGEFNLFDGEVAGESVYIATSDLSDVGWKLVTVLPKAEISDKVNGVVQLSVLTAVVLAAVFIALSLYIANRVSGAISQVGDKLLNMSASGGDLTQRLDASTDNELGYLARGFNAILAKFSDLVREIKDAETAINAGVGNLKNTSLQSVEYSEDQRRQTEMVATAITEMGQTIGEVSSIAHKTATETTSAVKDTHETNDVMLRLATTMNELAGAMKQSEASITELAGQAEAINSVVDVISSISEQTNLLALNAAIEAARAGEQGRGFAVVADEVRTLASRTQDSTKEIRTQIEQLQSAASASLRTIKTGAQSSLELADSAESASASLTGIRTRFDSISDGNHQVAAATEEQTSVVDHINESAQTIATMANNIHASAESQLQEIDTLTARAQHMREIVSQFKV
ncbi:methyl-accepting chemotaxis protein [Bowmanella pacifica]|uniref:Energy taxis-modulating methyl-accepting chemotaxis protein with Cache_1 sensory domain n=1 Tax=Bowmanella pacifica TaxID=502051 RepID=A0A917YXB4_9ALTE|nr:methyl-accepting chemotaxis protein [Bowmanella pacifica]GGO68026.1 energy taxis-modulating methyl-accepting chemotaxis protein with Cache_1 sensory domain [Bowmanella pacifica]